MAFEQQTENKQWGRDIAKFWIDNAYICSDQREEDKTTEPVCWNWIMGSWRNSYNNKIWTTQTE
jgi:hypothetical protein